MAELTSAGIPAIAPDDHVRGEGPEVVLYVDLGCPHCARTWAEIRMLPLRLCLRHFPIPAKNRRAPALHAAAEAAGAQLPDAFWQMVDAIYADHGHQDDPHLWQRARALELDLGRFERDRRSDAVSARIRRDFESGIRAGITGTPAAFVHGKRLPTDTREALAALTSA